jgi:preprotein translocase subunit SecG
MFTLISVIILIVCILLLMVVLVQNSKGGGLASNFASSNQMMGVRRTADFLEKATWALAGTLLVLSIMASWTIPKQAEQNQTRIERQIDNGGNFDPATLPNPGTPSNVPEDDGTNE